MLFSSEISFKNLAMEKVSSPFINNVWKACTVVSLVTVVFLLLYLNQGSRDFVRTPPDAMPSVSISSIHVFPSSRTQPPPDSSVAEKNVTLDDPFAPEKNATLEHLLTITKNETLNYPLATEKNKTLKVPSATEKNKTSEDSPQFKTETSEDSPQLKTETSEDSPQLKTETSEDSPQLKTETSEDSPQLKTETSEDSPQVKNKTLEDSPQVKNETVKDNDRIAIGEDSAKGDDNYCDVFDGRWVHDPTNSPMYEPTNCPFLSDQVNCRRNGRPDLNYERWNWVGSRCEIPRMNKTDFLERLRGKRVIVVGDSLNRNMFESLVCLLYSSVPSSDSYVDVQSGVYKSFRVKSYRCSVEFYWAPFLVEMEQEGQQGTRILTLDRINPSAKKWKGANVMIFNTGHWWVHLGKLKAWDVIRYKRKTTESMELELAFQKAMKTWSNWVDRNVDPAQTTVFFRSISPEHKGKNWCFEPTEPLMDESYIEIFPRSVRAIVESRIRSMKTPVRYLNITKLAEYRIDAHPKIYTTKRGELLTMDQRKQPKIYADCSHWCIPGVPDTWNRLVYASLVLDGFGANSTSLNPKVSFR